MVLFLSKNILVYELINTNFDFYDQNRKLIRSCDDLLAVTLDPKFMFTYNDEDDWPIQFDLIYNKFENPICPLVFRNAVLSFFRVLGLINTCYLRNVLTFTNLSSSTHRLPQNLTNNVIITTLLSSDVTASI